MIILLIIGGCQQRSRVKGIRDIGKFNQEPEIEVQLSEGETRKLKLEEYIVGVVAGEMKKDWPLNAYAAQSILARTFALKYLDENKARVISSSYRFAQEYKPENITDQVKKAVKNTRGEVVLYDNDFIKAWFHASAGGRTTSARVGLAYEGEEPPYITSVKSPDQEAPADVQNWKAVFSGKDLVQALREMGYNPGEIREIRAVDRDHTGRIINLKFSGSRDTVTVKAANFRKQLDPKQLKSTLIKEIQSVEGGYSFAGTGFGHGVGLSQWGAYALAREGKSPEEIVEHYFKEVEIARIYN